MIFIAAGGNHGLANNGIHEADLFVFHDQAASIEPVNHRINLKLESSKRGQDIFDLSGTLTGVSDKGSDFVVSFAPEHTSPDSITLLSPSARFFVDHFQKLALESYARDDWRWQQIPISENWMVSHMTKDFVDNIFARGTCLLPTLKSCYPAHQFILNALLPYFHRLTGRSLDVCPVT